MGYGALATLGLGDVGLDFGHCLHHGHGQGPRASQDAPQVGPCVLEQVPHQADPVRRLEAGFLQAIESSTVVHEVLGRCKAGIEEGPVAPSNLLG
eukprot:2569258-Alexandrium_andersonii.AAC.1